MTVPDAILFARHGNTFGPGDKVVWVGRASDLPLVERGVEQAHEAAAALDRLGLRPTAVVSGTLKRTRGFAEIVCRDLGIADRRVDGRLDEIDYGAWEGLSSDEIAALPGGAAAQEAWQKNDVWPEGAGWGSTRAEVLAALGGVLADLAAGAGGARPLAVSSNGILRFAPGLLSAPAAGPLQLKTGAMGCVERAEGGWAMRFWGLAPKDA
ncbi:MAG: histidine phosphatase family protein [Magnetospirillum sp.]|nr:histidine phosphatase family protein [Magnetospirillum sp.]